MTNLNRLATALCAALPVACSTMFVGVGSAYAQSFLVRPYLQLATPESVVIAWETDEGEESRVDWGPTDELGNQTTGTFDSADGGFLHLVTLDDLEAGETCYYRVHTGSLAGEIQHFVVPADAGTEASLRILAMSDMQVDRSNPQIFGEIIDEGVIPYVREQFGEDLASALSLTLIPGDLVDNGNNISEWRETFFAPAAALSAKVPMYPVYGNHEANTASFTRYFVLPENGTPGFLEHWWWMDASNVRIIGLDSQLPLPQQLDWLDDVLTLACDDDVIDFVFVQLHHPYLSELWVPGESDFSRQVVERVDAFSSSCGKPSVNFFGHTHGYSRGQSQDHRHLWVNVASAGGAIDYWGEQEQRDYDEFTVSDDSYGFVIVETDAGDNPEIRLRRVSRGDLATPLNNLETDTITVPRYNARPDTPRAFFPRGHSVSPDCFELAAGSFGDSDGHEHQATHWQLAESCVDFSSPVLERWRQRTNMYFGVDTQAGDDLSDEEVTALDPEHAYCWRVRYRDSGLMWSEWSTPSAFETTASELSANLVRNGGAEEGLEHWELVAGSVETPGAGLCGGTVPHTGERYFAVGGVCETSAYGELAQDVDLDAHSADIDGGDVLLRFGAQMADHAGADVPSMWVSFETHNLVTNGGAEGDLDGWTIREGLAESVGSNECGGTQAFEGARYFALGGLCGDSTETAELVQDIDLSPWSVAVDSGVTRWRLSAAMSNHSGADRPSAFVRFLDGAGVELSTTPLVSHTGAEWRTVSLDAVAPNGARVAQVVLSGRRNSGDDNDSYVDDVFFGFSPESERIAGARRGWHPVAGSAFLPPGVDSVRVHLAGERNSGDDNDSYVDEVYLRFGSARNRCVDAPQDPGPGDDTGADVGMDAGADSGADADRDADRADSSGRAVFERGGGCTCSSVLPARGAPTVFVLVAMFALLRRR